ncbi:uncharacterized protein LOC114530867 [Dendronephthya gigantea]|uniref:uncharacterized protein LOC114530867 n=1 Tax=Dendronephthya gigantea TaxID=151771 RepID=UPI00106D62EA|nr:uncharacterized protein LOC114530867 [Dendronephthya gigantea]
MSYLHSPPYIHPDFGTKEPPLVPAAQIYKDLVTPLLTSEDDDVISPIFVLNMLMKCLSCGLISTGNQSHWILDQEPLQLLFILLEMYQDCEQFWNDWVMNSRDDEMVGNDVALDEAWTEMNVVLKIVEEFLIPLLAENISHEPVRYHDYIPSIQDHLNMQDWTPSLLLIPLLQNDIFKKCTIKVPSPIIDLFSSHLNVEPIQDQESPFWTMYFRGCASSNEVCGMCLSKLEEGDAFKKEACDNNQIIHALATLLPFCSWTQWKRVLRVTAEMMKYKYLVLPEDWKTDMMVLPDISNSDDSLPTSELLLLILRDISRNDWTTAYVWNTALKNYVSTMKELSLEIGKNNNFEVSCHVLAHLAYIAFKIVPEALQENIIIILLDIFNQCLLRVSDENMDQCLNYLQGICDMISRTELKLTMKTKMDKMFPANVLS